MPELEESRRQLAELLDKYTNELREQRIQNGDKAERHAAELQRQADELQR